MKYLSLVFPLITVIALPLAACGGSGSASHQTESMDDGKLRQFAGYFPRPMTGWTASPPATKITADKSMISEVYTATQGDQYSIEIVFSGPDADKFRDLLNDETKRNKAGASTGEFNGQTALVFDSHQVTPASYVAVVGDDRVVSTTPVLGNTTKPIMHAAFEQIDFNGIASQSPP